MTVVEVPLAALKPATSHGPAAQQEGGAEGTGSAEGMVEEGEEAAPVKVEAAPPLPVEEDAAAEAADEAEAGGQAGAEADAAEESEEEMIVVEDAEEEEAGQRAASAMPPAPAPEPAPAAPAPAAPAHAPAAALAAAPSPPVALTTSASASEPGAPALIVLVPLTASGQAGAVDGRRTSIALRLHEQVRRGRAHHRHQFSLRLHSPSPPPVRPAQVTLGRGKQAPRRWGITVALYPSVGREHVTLEAMQRAPQEHSQAPSS